MRDFYMGVVEDSEMTIFSRIAFVGIILAIFFIPYFISFTSIFLNAEYDGNILAIAFVCVVTWFIVVMVGFIVFMLLFFAVKSVIWIFTGNWPSFDTGDIWQGFGKYIFSPLLFLFHFLFSRSDYKSELFRHIWKKLFQKKNERAKEYLINE